MTEPTIFTADPAAVAPVTNPAVAPVIEPVIAPVTPAIAPVPPELSELVGVGKKYSSVEQALAALPHAQTHIGNIEAENARMKEELTKRATAAELLADIQKGTPAAVTPAPVEVSTQLVSDIVKQQIEANSLATQKDANAAIVLSAFTKAFGDKSEVEAQRIATENGMSMPAFEQLIFSSPQAALKLAGITNNIPAPSTGFKGDVNSQLSFGTPPAVPTARVQNYGNSKEVAQGFANARAIVAARNAN